MVFGRKKKKKEKKKKDERTSGRDSSEEETVTLLDPQDDDSLLAMTELDTEEIQAAAAWTGTVTSAEEDQGESIPSEQGSLGRESDVSIHEKQIVARTPILRALLVEIRRQLEARLDAEHQIKSVNIDGQVVVLNQSDQDRIWDIQLKFRGSKGMKIKPEYRIAELQPDASWRESFEIKSDDESHFLPIKYEESITTSLEAENPISVFIHGKNNPTRLSLKIHVLQEMEKVVVTKKIPSFFSSSPTIKVSKGEVYLSEQGEFRWEITDIYKDTLLEATFSADVHVTDTSSKSTEPTRIEFVSKSEDDFIDVIDVMGLVKNKSWINSDELDEAPGKWENRLIFRNESNCVVKLVEVEVKDEQQAYIKERLDMMEELVHPKTEWASQTWISESRGFPSFNSKILFTVLPEIRYLTVGVVTVDPLNIPVAKISAERTYNTLDLRSFDTNPLEAVLKVENVGTTTISELVFIEKFPEHFIIPDSVDVEIWKKGSSSGKKLSYGDYSLVFYPDDREPDHPHEMKFTLNVPLPQNHELIVTYQPTAEKPPKGESCEVSGHVEMRLAPTDPPIELPLPRDPIVFRVVHQRHRVSFGKQVREGERPGEYHVSVWFKNRSDISMEDVVLQDILPDGFSIVKNSHESLMKKAKVTDGTALRWQFKKLDPGEEITVEYVLKGTGNYSPSKIQLM